MNEGVFSPLLVATVAVGCLMALVFGSFDLLVPIALALAVIWGLGASGSR